MRGRASERRDAEFSRDPLREVGKLDGKRGECGDVDTCVCGRCGSSNAEDYANAKSGVVTEGDGRADG